MPDNLKEWVISGMQSGYGADQLRQVLMKIGFSPEEVEQEMAYASPYIEVSHRLKKKINAREALLKTLDHQMRAVPRYLNIEKTELPPFQQFLQEYYYPNLPGLFSNVLDNCEAKNWTPGNLVGKVGVDTIIEMQEWYNSEGENEIIKYRHGPERYTKQVKFGDLIDRLENNPLDNNYYMTACNYTANNAPLRVLQKDLEDIGDGYLVPEAAKNRMDFFIGPKGTLTPAHHDYVNIMFTQIYGRKLIRLVPAMQVPYLYSDKITFTSVDLLDPKPDQTDFSKATVIEIEVGPGDALFIPIGWWHHVVSLSVSISVACCNIRTVNDYDNILVDIDKVFGF